MAFIKFTNRKKPVEAQAKKLNKHQIEITGCDKNTSGFLCYQDAEMKRLYGDYTDFTTLYRELDESYILSNNGSVYPDTPDPEMEPTVRELLEVLEKEMNNTRNAIAANYEQGVAMAEELTNTQIALTENFEQGLLLAEEITNTQIAVTEIYEMILGGV